MKHNVHKLAYTDHPQGQVKLARANGCKISHTDSVPLEISVKKTGTICRKVIVKTLSEVWYQDAVTVISVPMGFTCDLASLPRFLWCLLNPYDLVVPAIFHDSLYRSQKTSRRYADYVMFSVLEQLGSPWYVRYPIWIALRLFGGKAWEKDGRILARVKK